jgi:hypothetical protein
MELKILITKEMNDFFKLRTRAHLYLVNKYHNKISKLKDPRIDQELFDQERDEHDAFKWVDPENTPYVLLTWRYEQRRKGLDLELPDSIKDAIHEATFHHIKNHRHHPEFWCDTVTDKSLNKDNRDKPSGEIVDGTKMPLTYVAAMVADWMAMSEELGTDPKKWANDNVNVRWRFTYEQVDLINYLIQNVWEF